MYNLILRLSQNRFLRFLTGGGIGYVLEITILLSLVKFLDMEPMFSYIFALTVGTLFLFTYHYSITFRVKKIDTPAYPIFFVFTTIIAILCWSFSFALVEGYNFPYLSTIIGTNMSLSVVNYYFNRLVVFV